MSIRTTGIARRSGTGNTAYLLHPATRRAVGVRGSVARFRAWRNVRDKPRRNAPAGVRSWTATPDGRGFYVGLQGPRRSDRTHPDSVPAEDHSAGVEQGLTARPSPLSW
jgi:hypothetical protein